MMSCVESYTILKEALKYNTSENVEEAIYSLDRFSEVFYKIDATINDPAMIDICVNLAEIHFKGESPLDKKPIETIQNMYYERTGHMISVNLCIAAYYNALQHYAGCPDTHVSNGED